MNPQCNACGGALRTRFDKVLDPLSKEHFEIAACESCGLGHTLPQPEDLGRYYGPAYHGGRHGFTARYCVWRRERFVAPLTGPSNGRRLLDIGCGDGTWLLNAKDHGWQVVGTEMNPSIARGEGLEVYESLDQVPGRFSCITTWHSLEHMRDPAATLKKAAALLEPDGWLFAAVPDAQGLQAKVFGSKWFHLDVPRHLFHFGERSLGGLLQSLGFSVEKTWHQELELDLFGWTQSALNNVMEEPNVLFYRLTGRPTPANGAQVAKSFALGSAFTAAALPAVPLATMLGKGGTLVMAARRRALA